MVAVGGDVVLFGQTAEMDRLAELFADRGWRVWSSRLLGDEHGAGDEAVADLLAAQDGPDRAVLLAHGAAGTAVFEFADLHPERALAVVGVGMSGTVERSDLCCPSLILPAGDAESVGTAVAAFLDELELRPGRPGRPVDCPVRLPALTPALLNDPSLIRQLRRRGPVHRINAPGVATSWVVTGHEATTTALADPKLVGEVELTAGFRLQSDNPAIVHRGEQDLVTIDGREHARLRRLVGRYLTPARVEELRPRLQRATDALLGALLATRPVGEPVDLLETFARPLPVIVLCELFGIPGRDRGYLYEWLIERMTVVPPSAHADIDGYLRALIAERREHPSDDLLGWVVQAEKDELDEDDLISAARLLMVGGHRAPTTLLANGIAALLLHREQWRRLTADPALVPAAVEELLRFVTPFPIGLARQASGRFEVSGIAIPDGDLVAASLVAANRDPDCFAEPDVLDIGRRHNPHLAFGHGHHYCLGAALARAEAQVAIGTLARRFPEMELAEEAGDLQYRQSRVRYLLKLPVVLQPAGIPSR